MTRSSSVRVIRDPPSKSGLINLHTLIVLFLKDYKHNLSSDSPTITCYNTMPLFRCEGCDHMYLFTPGTRMHIHVALISTLYANNKLIYRLKHIAISHFNDHSEYETIYCKFNSLCSAKTTNTFSGMVCV